MPIFDYFFGMIGLIEDLTDTEFDRRGWVTDPDLDLDARDLRDAELMLDLSGNLDSCA